MRFIYSDGGRSQYFKGEAGDCVCRAICNATGRDYKEVYDMINLYSKRKRRKSSARNGVSKEVIREVLSVLGWKWTPLMQIGSGCKVHLKEDELPQGTIIVSLSRHLSCVKDGVIYDTYDCSRDETRCVYGYWSK